MSKIFRFTQTLQLPSRYWICRTNEMLNLTFNDSLLPKLRLSNSLSDFVNIQEGFYWNSLINVKITHADWQTEWGMLRARLHFMLFLSIFLHLSLWLVNRVHHRQTHRSEREREGGREREEERERERGRKRGREKEKEREREGERERERERIWLLLLTMAAFLTK